MPDFTVALVQMRCDKAAMEENLAATERYIAAAAGRGTDIVCFPEASITGYVDPERYPGVALDLDSPEIARFAAMTRGTGITAIAGIVEGNPGALPYLTQLVVSGGQLTAVYRKMTIPDEEAHLYTPGAEVVVAERTGVPFGLAICADIESAAVFAGCAERDARIVFESAAPGLYGEQETRDWASGYDWWRGECHTKLGRYARENGIYIAVATQAGRTRDEDFPGGGYLFAPDGACITETGDWSEGVLYTTISLP